jgi:hypothetical protein
MQVWGLRDVRCTAVLEAGQQVGLQAGPGGERGGHAVWGLQGSNTQPGPGPHSDRGLAVHTCALARHPPFPPSRAQIVSMDVLEGRALLGTSTGSVLVVDVGTGRSVAALGGGSDHMEAVTACGPSHYLQHFVTSSRDSHIKVGARLLRPVSPSSACRLFPSFSSTHCFVVVPWGWCPVLSSTARTCVLVTSACALCLHVQYLLYFGPIDP